MVTRKCFTATIALLLMLCFAQHVLAQQGAPPLREQPVRTPDVTRMPLEKAREVAKKAGFELTVIYKETSQMDADNVILEQQLAALRGAKSFTVHVGKYKAPPVPRVSNMPLEQAKEVLQKAGYEAKVVEAPVTDEKRFGLVVSQELKAQPGSNKITVFVGAPEKVLVPGVASMAVEQAIKTLEKAGLKGAQTPLPTTQQNLDGRVLRQNPAAGTRVLKDSVVTLTVQTYKSPYVIMPNLVGMPESDAKQKMSTLHCGYTWTLIATPWKEMNHKVIAQDPAPNTEIKDHKMPKVTVGYYSAHAIEVQMTPNPADKSYRMDIKGGMPPFTVEVKHDAALNTAGKKVVEITALPQTPGVSSFRIVALADVKAEFTITDSKHVPNQHTADLKKDAR